MKRKKILLVGLSLFFCSPNLGLADCTELANFNRFYVQDDGSIIFYYNNIPLGKVELQDCTVDSTSEIRLLKGSVCDNDEILVDGERCTIMGVKVPE